jgi:phosphoribosyl 1,2-cyclic phosphate phosphodiesterase
MSVKFTILGCGSSLGVPRIDGHFGKCNSKENKNYRTRCSALISTINTNILIDTSPDIKIQLLKNNVKNIDRVLYSHFHADQTHGINELRLFYLKNRCKIPVYTDQRTKKYLLSNFNYCFKKSIDYSPFLKMNSIKKIHLFKDNKDNILIRSIKVKHGKVECIAFIINKSCAYVSDVNKIYKKDLKHFNNLKVFVVDCLRYKHHPSHFNLDDVLKIIKIIKPKKTILTNLNIELDYNELKMKIPRNVVPAYDGMSFSF